MVAVLELVGLYSDVNQDIIDGQLHAISPQFRAVTSELQGIREKLIAMQVVKPNDDDIRFANLWNFYRKDLIEDAGNAGENLQRDGYFTVLPKVPKTSANLQLISEIGELADEFVVNVETATRVRCCFFCRITKMFGSVEQNTLLLNKNFEGKHFWVTGHNGARLDCMFFPCTVEDNKDNINTEAPSGLYLEKPTVIICNPNALIYQQMVTSPNSYWLSFFLKRQINVMCWNYRNYGKSSAGLFTSINPYNCKLDAERVLDFVINKMKIKGKIGVYGRSLGGIASCHLANRFPNIIQALIVDRTFSELDMLAERRVPGRCSRFLVKLISFNWKALNDRNFIETKCFKITTCDPLDDVVENFSSLNVGVAVKYAKASYSERKYVDLFDHLWLLH